MWQSTFYVASTVIGFLTVFLIWGYLCETSKIRKATEAQLKAAERPLIVLDSEERQPLEVAVAAAAQQGLPEQGAEELMHKAIAGSLAGLRSRATLAVRLKNATVAFRNLGSGPAFDLEWDAGRGVYRLPVLPVNGEPVTPNAGIPSEPMPYTLRVSYRSASGLRYHMTARIEREGSREISSGPPVVTARISYFDDEPAAGWLRRLRLILSESSRRVER
jgi:hypothetical protein